MHEYLARLQDPNPSVRQEAAWDLGRMGTAAATPEVLGALIQRLRKDEDWVVRMAAAEAMGEMGEAAATPEVLGALAERLLQDEAGGVREAAAKALVQMGKTAATPEVIQALSQCLRKDEDKSVRREAAWALGKMGTAAATPEVIGALAERLLQDEEGWVRWAAVWALRQLLPAHPEALRNFLCTRPAPKALEEVFRDSPGAVPALRALLSDPDPEVRLQAVWALGAMGEAAATPEVVRDLLLRRLDEDPNVRTAALEVLRELPVSPETVSAVLRDIRGDEPEAAEATAWALERLG